MSDQLWWYTARAGGFVSWGLLAASVLWGLAISTKATGKRVRPNWMLDLHRFLGGLAVVFTAVHVLAIVADSYVHFGLADVLVPFASSWQPIAVAWGIVGMYLLIAIEISSLLRKHIPKRAWRAIHFASFPLYAIGTVHAFAAGTDTGSRIFTGVAVAASIATVVLTIRRINQSRRATPRPSVRPVRPAVAPSASVVTRPLRTLPPPPPGTAPVFDPGFVVPQRQLAGSGRRA
jgi:DMSO/TMAO reductase YedYZ heme-binding membrane subunit